LDYPHVEGGRNPMKRFNASMPGVSAAVRKKFVRDNFIALMGAGLDARLHDIQRQPVPPGLSAAGLR
jgi:uncharacterized protein